MLGAKDVRILESGQEGVRALALWTDGKDSENS